MRISDWSSDVCSSDLPLDIDHEFRQPLPVPYRHKFVDRAFRPRLRAGLERKQGAAMDRGQRGLGRKIARNKLADPAILDQRASVARPDRRTAEPAARESVV